MLQVIGEEKFNEVFAIMQASFPLDEYREYEAQKGLLSRAEYRIYGVVDKESGRIKAFLAAYDLAEFLFMEHFAVQSSFRNQGLGGVLIEEIVKLTDKPVCLEVEPPHTEVAARRIGFYRRNGFVLNPYPYVQPALSFGKKPIDLYLMSSPRGLSKEEFERVRKALYTNVYGQTE